MFLCCGIVCVVLLICVGDFGFGWYGVCFDLVCGD